MLHIIKQYRKMMFSFLENNLNGESIASEVSSKLDSNSDKKISKKEMQDALNNPELSEEVRSIISTIESKIKKFQHIGDFEKSYTVRFTALKDKQKTDLRLLSSNQVNAIDEVVTHASNASNLLSYDIKEQKITNVDITGNTDKVSDGNETLDYNSTLDLLSDLNSDKDLDDQNVLDEANLRTTISHLSNGGEKSKLLKIYENVTGKNVVKINKDNVKDFHEKFVFNIRFMQGLGYANGAYALLDGKMDDFVKQVPRGSKLEISSIDKLSPGVQNAVGALVSAGILILTQGVVVVSREVKQYKGNEVIEKIERSKEGEPLSKLKQFLTFIKDAFTGRRLSFSIGEDDVINVRKFEESITIYATGVLDLKLDGNDTELPEGLSKDKYNETLKLSKQFGLDINKIEDKKSIQGILIQDFILSEGTKRQGTDWKATIGLLFIGAHRDKIGVETVPLKSNEVQAEVERKLTRRTLDSKALESIGISVTKNGEKFEHTLPQEGSMIKLPGDDKEFPIKEIKPEGIRDTLTNSDIKYDFHFSFVGGRGKDYYTLTLTPSTSKSSGASGDFGLQKIDDVRKIRTGKDLNTIKLNEKQKESIKFGEALYTIGHDIRFGKLVKLISTGDQEGVRVELNRLASIKGQNNTNRLAKALLSNIDNFAEWDSYMSGSLSTKREKTPKYDNVRLADVVKAEVALAKASGFPVPSLEKDFKVTGKYSSKQISEIFTEQEITSVQFMTPLDANNVDKSRSLLHRVSVVDGSFAISEKYQDVIDQARKESIVEGLLKSSHESRAIKNQIKKLNEFLSKYDKKVEVVDYIKFLKSGKIEDLKVSGLKLQKGKDTKFLEARAMVAGNVCLNATYAIAYPAFEFEGGNKQNVDSVSSVDYTAANNFAVIEGIESGIGVNPIAVGINLKNGSGNNPKDGGVSTNPNGTGGQIPSSTPTQVADTIGQTTTNSAATVSGGGGFIPPSV